MLENTGYKSEKHKMLLSLASSGSLSEKEEKMLALLNMGYSAEEASIAMDRCGAYIKMGNVCLLIFLIVACNHCKFEHLAFANLNI